jgi:hypothetical protein
MNKAMPKSKRKSKKSKLNKSILTIGLFFLVALSYFILIRLPKRTTTPIGINEVAISSATTKLSLPATLQTTKNTDSSLDLTIDTGNAKVAAVQVELSYDPAQLSTPTLVQGDFLTDKLGTPKVEGGKIFFVYAAPISSGGKSGSGKLATLKFKPLAGDTQIKFTSNTMVAAVGSNTNALLSATGTTIQTSSGNTSPVAPPVLSDIILVPTPIPTTQPKTQKPVASAKTNQSQVNKPATTSPSFRPEQDFDYSTSPATQVDQSTIPTDATTISKQSAFARFLAFIKSFFGGQNAQN